MEGTIQVLFEGHIMKYVECINVDYKSTEKESFYGTLSFDLSGTDATGFQYRHCGF